MGYTDRTTITLHPDLKERLEDLRHRKHNSWNQFFEGILEILPTADEIAEGCTNDDCDRSVVDMVDGPYENYGGVIHWYSTEHEGHRIYGRNWFCSPECAYETDQEMKAMAPREPDEVIVGGKDQIRASFSGAKFHIDGEVRQVGIEIPGAFKGQDSHGDRQYDYHGEPVYIKNEGDIVQTGVIEEIHHEDAWTGLSLENDHEVVMKNHPVKEKREEYERVQQRFRSGECPYCDNTIRVDTDDMNDNVGEHCPHCEDFVQYREIEWE